MPQLGFSRRLGSDPCKTANGPLDAVPSIAASLAHDCLQSVPFNKERAAGILKALEPYLDWQSDAAYLKDPPTDYEYSPYDLFAGFKEVMSKVDAGKYSGEYEFQKDIQQKIYFPGVDGHFWLTADSMSVFSFRSPRGVVSYSEDGVALPVIKILGKLLPRHIIIPVLTP